MAIRLETLGGLRAADDSGELDWLLGQHSRAALFVYLAIDRRVSREALTALFWPESDTENARHALRQSLYHLRKGVGSDWIESRAHELVVTDAVRTDAHDFAAAVERGDFTAAVGLYRGPFLDGVHLVDLQPWESWVDARRAQHARAFRKASRELIAEKRAAGDLAGAIAAAERWATRDPLDDEAQYRLIESLAGAGERAEAIRQYETYARTLEADGLQPPDETTALAATLRSGSALSPASRAAFTGPDSASSSDTGAMEVTAARSPDARAGGDPRGGPAPVHRRRRRLHPAAAATAVLATVAVAVWWGVSRPRATAAPASSPTAIAVLPFSVRGGESVAYLGEGMVSLLGAALDGAGSLRTADTRATFAAMRDAGETVPDAKVGERVATRLGAGMYVSGEVVEAGGQLQIEAAAYDATGACGWLARRVARPVGCTTTPRARAVVSGSSDSAFALVDALAARLLGALGDPAADRLLRTASVTTTSLAAFKAYLQGDGMMRDGQFERAADSYLDAVRHDSTFAVAHYRLALAREWAPLPGEDEAAAAAARHAARLAPRDRRLLEAFRQWRSGDAMGAERAYRAIIARHRDDIEAWFQLGEILFHHGPLLGRRIGESEAAWREVLAREPRNLFALTHLARIAAAERRSAALDSLLAPFTANELMTDRRLAELTLLRAATRGDTATARAIVADAGRWEPLSTWRAAAWLTAFSSDPAFTGAVMRRLAGHEVSPALRADLHWFASVLDLAAGRLGAARTAHAAAVATERSAPEGRQRPAFEAVTDWFAATLPLPYAETTVVSARRRAGSAPMRAGGGRRPFVNEIGLGTPIRLEPLRQYTLGMLSLRLRDVAAAERAAATLKRVAAAHEANPLVRDLDRGLRARLAWHHGRPDEALRLLDAMEARDTQGDITVIPFVARANERFLRAEVLLGIGRDADALRWLESLGYGAVTELPLLAPAHLRQAEIHERRGRRAQASRHYARFVELWREADPELQPLVETARQRLGKLARPD